MRTCNVIVIRNVFFANFLREDWTLFPAKTTTYIIDPLQFTFHFFLDLPGIFMLFTESSFRYCWMLPLQEIFEGILSRFSLKSCSYSEKLLYKSYLTLRIIIPNDLKLLFSNHVHCFISRMASLAVLKNWNHRLDLALFFTKQWFCSIMSLKYLILLRTTSCIKTSISLQALKAGGGVNSILIRANNPRWNSTVAVV